MSLNKQAFEDHLETKSLKVFTDKTSIFKNICPVGEDQHRLKQLADALGLSVAQMEKELDVATSRLNKAIQRDSKIGMDVVLRILDKYPRVSKDWLMYGTGTMFNSETNVSDESPKYPRHPFRDAIDLGAFNDDDPTETRRGKEFVDLGNGHYRLTVELVPYTASAGYLRNYGDPMWLEELPKHSITVDFIPAGIYRTFVARGDSMDSGGRDSICNNDKVTGRVIDQIHWRSKLHLHKYRFFVIVHKEGITVKEIIKHDVENGIITIHSLNPDKDSYPDQELDLRDVLQLLNVIKIERDL